MKQNFYFTFESDWREAPVAFWLHAPVSGTVNEYWPSSPEFIPHKGYLFLHVEFDTYDLQFSALVQLDHFIDGHNAVTHIHAAIVASWSARWSQ